MAATEFAPKRRWLGFILQASLGAIAIVSTWVAWNLHQMHKREVMLRQPGITYVAGNESKKLPWLWRTFEARSIWAVNLDPEAYTAKAQQRYASMFPEATVTRDENFRPPPVARPSDAAISVPIE
jgi:hypothetical protein